MISCSGIDAYMYARDFYELLYVCRHATGR